MNSSHHYAGRAAATATAEQSRLAALDDFVRNKAIDCPNFEALVATARADGRSWPGDLAQAIIRDIQQANATALAAAMAAAGSNTSAESAARAGRFPDLYAVEKEANQQWEQSAAVRAEFPSRETFIAYRMAVARGAAREMKPSRHIQQR